MCICSLYLDNNVYLLDPTKSRSSLFSKLFYPNLSEFKSEVQNKKMSFINCSSVNLLIPGSYLHYIDVKTILCHVENNLIRCIKSNELEKEIASDSNTSDNEDQ